MTQLLVVDLCGTVVHENTTHGFLRFLEARENEWQRRLLLCRPALALGHWIPAFHHRDRLIACLRGLPRMELERQARRYAQASLERNGRDELIARLRQVGQDVVLASASLDVIVSAFAESLGVTQWVATDLEYDADGICLGMIRRDATGRKRQLVEHLLNRTLADHVVITDNPEDVDLMPGARQIEFLYASHS